MAVVKNFGKFAYLIFVSLAAIWLGWQIYYYKLTPRQPAYQVVSLFPIEEKPVWEASGSASLAASQKLLDEQLSAQAYLVMDVDSRTIILEKNADTLLPPASTTKLMTALTALDLYGLEEVVTVSAAIADEHDGGDLFANEQLTVRNLLISSLVSSANDAAYALANHHRQGEAAFVLRMNELADEYGLTQTKFANPTGYDDPPNITTARDLSVLMLQVIQRPILLEWLSLEKYAVYNTFGNIRHFLFTTNQLLGRDPRVVAGKTGTTSLAQEVLITLSDHQGHLLITVVMNSEDRYADTVKLLEWLAKDISWQPGPSL
jgi:D-alanyl-D-alanine carboxypeptidase